MDGESCSPHSSRETIFERPLPGSLEWPAQVATMSGGKATKSEPERQTFTNNNNNNSSCNQQSCAERNQVNEINKTETPAGQDSNQLAAETKKMETKRLVTRPTSLFSSQRADTLLDLHHQHQHQHHHHHHHHQPQQQQQQQQKPQQHQPPVSGRLESQSSEQTVARSVSNQQLTSNRFVQQQKQLNQSMNNTTISINSTQTAVSTTDSSSQVQQIESGKRHLHSGDGSAADLSSADPQNPYPLYAPITFFYLNQTARPRSWCLAIVSNKYPNH